METLLLTMPRMSASTSAWHSLPPYEIMPKMIICMHVTSSNDGRRFSLDERDLQCIQLSSSRMSNPVYDLALCAQQADVDFFRFFDGFAESFDGLDTEDGHFDATSEAAGSCRGRTRFRASGFAMEKEAACASLPTPLIPPPRCAMFVVVPAETAEPI